MTDIDYSQLEPREYLDSNDLIFINSIQHRRFKNELLRFKNNTNYYLGFMQDNHMRLGNSFENHPTAVFFVKHKISNAFIIVSSSCDISLRSILYLPTYT